MRRAAVLAALSLSAAFAAAPSAGTAAGPPPLPCDYWVHGCNVLDYLCDAGVCVNTAAIPAIKI